LNIDQMRDAIEKMAQEQEGKYSELRKPTNTEVRQSRVQFEISPQWGIPSFTLGCVYCNTGYEDDYYAAHVGARMIAFFGRHKDCTPGGLPPEVRNRQV
jgi:hypothetical protein